MSYNPPKISSDAVHGVLKDRYDARILDCAAGTGLVGEKLRNYGYKNIDALDASQEMLDIAKQKNIYQKLICDFMGTNNLPLEADTYDAVVATGCFCPGHVNGSCLQELIRVTKPGGFIVLSMNKKYIDTKVLLHEGKDVQEYMDEHTENKRWQQVLKEVVPCYVDEGDGLLYIFSVL